MAVGVAVDDDDDDGQLNMVSVIEILFTWTNKKCQSQLGIDCCSKEFELIFKYATTGEYLFNFYPKAII